MTSIQGLLEVLWKPCSSGVSYCIGALLSLLCASWLFDVGFLLGTREYWQTRAHDISTLAAFESPPRYELAALIDFRTGGNSRDYLAGGWLLPGPAGSGLDGPNAYVEFPLAESNSLSIPAVLAGDRPALTLQFRATHRATESQWRDKRLDLGLQTLTVTAQA
jgi:hypothetical protein